MKILLTGASYGLGKHLRDDFLKAGHRVTGIGIEGPDVVCDFTNFCQPGRSQEILNVIAERGPYDIVINNAGTMRLSWFKHYKQQDLMESLYVNLVAPIMIMQRVYLEQIFLSPPFGGFWRFVNITSMAVKQPGRACVGYNASKAGLECAVRGLARELANNAFILSSVAPCIIEGTAMQERGMLHLIGARGMTPTEAEAYQTSNPLGRRASLEEIARVVKFAAFELPQAMSGTTLYVPAATGV
jgi:NAD(P)-dependent dehydrogenase (short-subunit alcohol dehydrogenase family)